MNKLKLVQLPKKKMELEHVNKLINKLNSILYSK